MDSQQHSRNLAGAYGPWQVYCYYIHRVPYLGSPVPSLDWALRKFLPGRSLQAGAGCRHSHLEVQGACNWVPALLHGTVYTWYVLGSRSRVPTKGP